MNLEVLNANLPALLSVTALRNGQVALWRHLKSRKGAASRIALYTPTTEVYEGEEGATFFAALTAPQPGSPATAFSAEIARRAGTPVGGSDLTGGRDAAPREWAGLNSDTE